jgi:hypothetical protein
LRECRAIAYGSYRPSYDEEEGQSHKGHYTVAFTCELDIIVASSEEKKTRLEWLQGLEEKLAGRSEAKLSKAQNAFLEALDVLVCEVSFLDDNNNRVMKSSVDLENSSTL